MKKGLFKKFQLRQVPVTESNTPRVDLPIMSFRFTILQQCSTDLHRSNAKKRSVARTPTNVTYKMAEIGQQLVKTAPKVYNLTGQ